MVSFALDVAILLGAFLGMEGVAWATHRYVMHSPLGWAWHASHHVEREDRGGFELNDLYAAVFATPAILLFLAGARTGRPELSCAGAGVTLYGLVYALVHDGLVHGRWPWRVRPRGPYARRLVQAHRLHHAVRGREGCVSFGFLIAPDVRRLKAQLKDAGGEPPQGKATPARQAAFIPR